MAAVLTVKMFIVTKIQKRKKPMVGLNDNIRAFSAITAINSAFVIPSNPPFINSLMEHNAATTQEWFNPYRVLPDRWTHLAAIAAFG